MCFNSPLTGGNAMKALAKRPRMVWFALLLPLILSACLVVRTREYDLRVENYCGFAVDLFIDGTYQNTIRPSNVLTVTGIREGTYNLLARGTTGATANRTVFMDNNKTWTLCR
jgi:hypothetical protein